MTPRLECTGLRGGYGTTTAFRDVDLAVDAGSIVALLGPNGAGKTTLLLTISGFLPPHSGTVTIDGQRLKPGRPSRANGAGAVLVPDNRSLFTTLTVEENLKAGCHRGGPSARDMIEVFPQLEERWNLRAGALSGGEQQMLAMARALVQEPRALLIDEMSMGLAPLVVESLFQTVQRIAHDHGCAVLLVEQHVHLALTVADRAAVLNRGSIVLRGLASELLDDDARLQAAYLGSAEATTTWEESAASNPE
jgi:branched-chain amino acid transport system ATP-binding protein